MTQQESQSFRCEASSAAVQDAVASLGTELKARICEHVAEHDVSDFAHSRVDLLHLPVESY